MKINEIKNIYYAAYGHNTNSKEMLRRCPSAVLVGGGIIKGFHLTFKHFANIEQKNGEECFVVVWRINAKDLKTLDRDEVFDKNYDRIEVDVIVDKKTLRAYIYTMDPKYHDSHPPTEQYIKWLVKGYREHNLPLDQIKKAIDE